MKPYVLSPAAKQDRRDELRYYRQAAGSPVANRLLEAIRKGLLDIERNPAIGSPRMGIELEIPGLRTWGVSGFPLSIWYFERDVRTEVVRIIGHRQDAEVIGLDDA